ncbi:MFS transporter [Streptomyces thermodiastaticus]
MPTAATPTPEQIRRRSLQSGTVGAIVEWYEYTVYGVTAALVFGRLFFPDLSPGIGQIVSLATFGVGFLARPVGAFVAGHLGDRIGRKSTLILTFSVMTTATAAIGLVPTYRQTGVAAPLLLCVLRLAQGVRGRRRVGRGGHRGRGERAAGTARILRGVAADRGVRGSAAGHGRGVVRLVAVR